MTSALLCAALLAACVGVAHRTAGADPPATAPARGAAVVQVLSTPLPSPRVAPGFVGIALEFDALTQLTGSDPRHIDPLLVRLIRDLAPGQAPVIRIGGDSTDYSWWPVPGLTRPTGVHYALTPRWMASARALAGATGGHLILGLNWAAADPALTLAEARAFAAEIGRSAIAELELGNEPGYYGHLPYYFTRAGMKVRSRPITYSLADYGREFAAIVPRLPTIPMAGPGDGNLPGAGPERAFVAGAPRLALVTMHRYPLIACATDPAKPIYPSTSHLLGRFATAGLARAVGPYVRVAMARRLPFRLDEMNSVACRGAAVSRTFASALWAVDALFQLARLGAVGANFNTFKDALYEPFGVTRAGGAWRADVRPMYYGMLLFSRAAPAGSRLMGVRLHAGGALRAWATRTRNGFINLVVINDSLSRARAIEAGAPGWQGGATLMRLTAPSATATHGITLGGQRFDASARLQGRPRAAELAPGRHGYTFTLPPASAALLTIRSVR